MTEMTRKATDFTYFIYFNLFFLASPYLFTGVFADENVATAGETLRFASYNIQICRGMEKRAYSADDFQDAGRTTEALKRLDADVIGLQEVDRRTNRSKGADQCAELAEKTGLCGTFARAIDLPGGEYGVAVLSKEAPLGTKICPLPGKEERRVLFIVEFENFYFFDTHFSLTEESRAESARIVNEELALCDKPVVFVGDLNVKSDAEREKLFGAYWTVLTPDAPTFPADKPRVRLDYIQIADPTGKIPVDDPRWREALVESGVADEPAASDHRPIYAELKRANLLNLQKAISSEESQ